MKIFQAFRLELRANHIIECLIFRQPPQEKRLQNYNFSNFSIIFKLSHILESDSRSHGFPTCCFILTMVYVEPGLFWRLASEKPRIIWKQLLRKTFAFFSIENEYQPTIMSYPHSSSTIGVARRGKGESHPHPRNRKVL